LMPRYAAVAKPMAEIGSIKSMPFHLIGAPSRSTNVFSS
jgi:hypothetical protein